MTDLIAQSQQGNPLSFLIFLIPLAFLFILMRSQKRKMAAQQARQQSAEVGDEIMTTAGIFGTIVDEDDEEGIVTVEIAPGTRIRMVRSGIARTLTEHDEELEDDPSPDDR
jgi:preprotein translocase subunit YajC